MSASRRRVTVFMIVGVIAAVLTGVVVWRMSLPTPPDEAGYEASATTSAAAATAAGKQSATASPDTARSGSSPAPETGAEQAGQDVDPVRGSAEGDAAAPARDPLLPPNAVVNSAPRAAAPTQVYRPSNVLPTTLAREDAGEASPASQPAEPSPSVTGTPGAPEPALTTSPGETAEPTGTVETPAQNTPSAPLDTGEKLDSILPVVPEAPAPAPEPPATQQYAPGSEAQNWWGRVRGYLRF